MGLEALASAESAKGKSKLRYRPVAHRSHHNVAWTLAWGDHGIFKEHLHPWLLVF